MEIGKLINIMFFLFFSDPQVFVDNTDAEQLHTASRPSKELRLEDFRDFFSQSQCTVSELIQRGHCTPLRSLCVALMTCTKTGSSYRKLVILCKICYDTENKASI